jgi:uncharacterized PurR-regulated membrane protein YhhQ (DUF165 family)
VRWEDDDIREPSAGRGIGALALVSYIATIFLANWMLARFGIIPIGFGLHAPAGVFAAGLAFGLRDEVQERLGIGWVLFAIVAGACVSISASATFAFASGITFLFSEFADFAVYTPIRTRSWFAAVVLSNTVGVLVDSVLFLWLAFGSFTNLIGLIVGKWYATVPVIVVYGVQRWRGRTLHRDQGVARGDA